LFARPYDLAANDVSAGYITREYTDVYATGVSAIVERQIPGLSLARLRKMQKEFQDQRYVSGTKYPHLGSLDNSVYLYHN
jgi:hypothetical protein